jgi:hypothetical protein
MSARYEESMQARTMMDSAGVGEAPAGPAPRGEMEASGLPEPPEDGISSPLLGEDQLVEYRDRWKGIQVRFVDDPRGTVKAADELVEDLMHRLSQTFADERASLESQWEQGADASTEDLRIAMQRYRSFFTRLLAA